MSEMMVKFFQDVLFGFAVGIGLYFAFGVVQLLLMVLSAGIHQFKVFP